jgi:dTDP-4-dehydrorhamnose reductase
MTTPTGTRSGRGGEGPPERPLCVTGASGTLGRAFARIRDAGGWPYCLLSRRDMDIAAPALVGAALDAPWPWAVVNTAGYVRVGDAEGEPERCFRENASGPTVMSAGGTARSGPAPPRAACRPGPPTSRSRPPGRPRWPW